MCAHVHTAVVGADLSDGLRLCHFFIFFLLELHRPSHCHCLTTIEPLQVFNPCESVVFRKEMLSDSQSQSPVIRNDDIWVPSRRPNTANKNIIRSFIYFCVDSSFAENRSATDDLTSHSLVRRHLSQEVEHGTTVYRVARID